MADSTIFGVYIPPPVSETSDDLSREHGMCTATMSVAAFFPTDTGIGEHSEPVRACLAARAYLYCAIRMGEEGLMRAFAKHSPGWNPVAVRRTMQPHAEALVKKMCADATISGHQQHALEEAERQWGQGMRRSR